MTEATTSPERQREQITAYCAAKDWHLVRIEEDLGESGSSVGKGLDRPALARIRAEWDQWDAMVAAKLDRIARNVSDFSALVSESQAAKCDLVAVNEGLDLSTPTGRFVATILAAFAQMEAEQIRERVTAMREDARRNHVGRHMGGAVPFGYKTAKRAAGGLTLVINDPEAALVREAASRVLAGDTLYAVSVDWNNRGITTKYGKKWMGQTIRAMLTGPSVIGAQSHKREPLRNEDGTIREVFPPIIDRDTWERLRRRLVKPEKRTPSRRLPARLLSGIARCGECGEKFYVRKRPGNRQDLYECHGRRLGKGCTVGSVVADDLDTEVVRQLMERAGWHLVVRRVEVSTDNSADLEAVEEAIRETTRRLAEDDDETAHLARLTELKQRRAMLRQSPEVAEEAEVLGNLDGYWRDSDFAERVRLLRDLLTAVKVSGQNETRGTLDRSRVELVPAPGVWSVDEAAESDQGTPVIVIGGPFRDLANMRAAVPPEFAGDDVQWFGSDRQGTE